MDGSRLTLLTQVNNQIDYDGDCFPYQQLSPFIEYSHSRNNWYSSQSDHHLPPFSSSPSCSVSSSSVPPVASNSSFGVSSFSPFLSSSLIDSADYSVTYGSGIGSVGGSVGTNISSYPSIEDCHQIMSASSTGSGHFTWDNLSSPINYHHHHHQQQQQQQHQQHQQHQQNQQNQQHQQHQQQQQQSPCWNVGSNYESEHVDRKPVIMTVNKSGEYDCASFHLINRRNDISLNNLSGTGEGVCDEDAEEDEEREEEDQIGEYDENYDSEDDNADEERELVIDTSGSSGGLVDNIDQSKGKSNDNANKFCQVCGDKSTGRHYNAFTCEGCKGFFRRSVMKGMKYACKSNTNKCPVDASNRRKCCRSCRLARCIAIGMNPDICLNKANDDSFERSSRANSLENMFENLNANYNEFLKPLMANYIECSDSGSCDQFYLSYIQFHFRMTNKLIYFESRLAPFTSLPAETRFLGVREAAHSVAILFILLHFDLETISILWPNGRQINEEQLKGSVFSGIRFTMFQLAKELKRHNIIEEELPSMILILLTLTFSREQFASTIISKCSSNKHHSYWNGHIELLHKFHNFTGVIKSCLNNYSSNHNRDYNPIVHHHFPYPSQTSSY